MKTTFACVAWMVAAVAAAGEFSVTNEVDELDGRKVITVGMQCDDNKSSAIVMVKLDDTTYGLGIIDTGFRVWVPDDMFKGPVKAGKYRASKMTAARTVQMQIKKKTLFTQISRADAVQILESGKLIMDVDGERFTVNIAEHRQQADEAISLIEDSVSVAW